MDDDFWQAIEAIAGTDGDVSPIFDGMSRPELRRFRKYYERAFEVLASRAPMAVPVHELGESAARACRARVILSSRSAFEAAIAAGFLSPSSGDEEGFARDEELIGAWEESSGESWEELPARELTRIFGHVSGQLSGPLPDVEAVQGIRDGLDGWVHDVEYARRVAESGISHLRVDGGLFTAYLPGDVPGSAIAVRRSGSAVVVMFQFDPDESGTSHAAGLRFVAKIVDRLSGRWSLPRAADLEVFRGLDG